MVVVKSMRSSCCKLLASTTQRYCPGLPTVRLAKNALRACCNVLPMPQKQQRHAAMLFCRAPGHSHRVIMDEVLPGKSNGRVVSARGSPLVRADSEELASTLHGVGHNPALHTDADET